MPRLSLHVLFWSELHRHYELRSQKQTAKRFHPGDESTFSCWLEKQTSFAFVGKSGQISVVKEARPRGTGYWYAYRRQDRHTYKRYLGSTARVTLARLEQVAKGLNYESEPFPGNERRASEGEASIVSQIVPESPGSRSNTLPFSEQRLVPLRSRLSPPRRSILLIERSRLLKDLDAVLTHSLVLVSASAGSGKTTLLSTWAASRKSIATANNKERAERAIAWLSLDALDDDPIRFWSSVISALQTCLPAIGVATLGMLQSAQAPSLQVILSSLLDDILEEGLEIILILDDYHLISDHTIHNAMVFWLDHLPGCMHFVLASRSDPEFPLSRLRIRGQLIEIRDQELRFTQAETTSFLLQSMNLPLSEEDVVTLHLRTEGWIAMLHLAALSLRKQQNHSEWIARFGGSYRHLMDYVQEELLVRLPAALQTFLLQTSILTRINAALCQAVVPQASREQCQQWLERLERTNLFVVPLDEHKHWYRYHDLFREALHARLHVSQPDQISLLHYRAARWYETQGLWHEAVVHALASPDYPLAASLMERAAPECWLNGEARIILNWVLCLPDVVLCTHMRLALNAAFRFLNPIQALPQIVQVRVVAQVEQAFSRLEEILRKKLELELSEKDVVLVTRRIRLLRALIEGWEMHKRGDQKSLFLLSQETEAFPPDEEGSWKLIPLTFTYWLIYAYQREAGLLLPRLLLAKQQVKEEGDRLATIRVMHMLAAAYTDAGQLHQVYRECKEGLALIEQMGAHTTLEGYFHVYLSFIYYAWNRLKEVTESLEVVERIARDWQEVDLQVMGETTRAWLAIAQGDHSTAQQSVQQVEELVAQERYAFHNPWLVYARVPYWLAQGNLTRAREWMSQIVFTEENWHPTRKWEALMCVRIALAHRQYEAAVEILSRFSQYLDRPGDLHTAVSFLAQQVVALYHAGKRDQAVRSATRLLAITEAEGYIRVYLDAGEPMRQVLHALLASPLTISRLYLAQLLHLFEEQEYIAEVPANYESLPTRTLLEPAEKIASPGQAEFQPLLSPQESKVLDLLADGKTYAQIARAHFVSLNTIKTQVSSIYRKLGVNNRAKAILAVQRFAWLSSGHSHEEG